MAEKQDELPVSPAKSSEAEISPQHTVSIASSSPTDRNSDFDNRRNSGQSSPSAISALTSSDSEDLALPNEGHQFVAEDFAARLRAANHLKASQSGSSLSSWASSYYGGLSVLGVSRSSSFPTGFHVNPDDIPEIDPHVLADLETHARRLADQILHLSGNLRTSLHSVTALTARHSQVHQLAVSEACDSVDAHIHAMYGMMAKCEEVTRSMQSVHLLRQDVENVKRVLDRLEAVLH